MEVVITVLIVFSIFVVVWLLKTFFEWYYNCTVPRHPLLDVFPEKDDESGVDDNKYDSLGHDGSHG